MIEVVSHILIFRSLFNEGNYFEKCGIMAATWTEKDQHDVDLTLGFVQNIKKIKWLHTSSLGSPR